MGEENLEDVVNDGDYQNALLAIQITTNLLLQKNDVPNAIKMYWSWKRISEDYIDFRLKQYDSEARMVIRETYKILGYNPNTKQLPPRKEE